MKWKVAATERLIIRKLTIDDAPFILKLLNTPSWLQFIGDKDVRTLEDARNYILNGPVDMYARLGLGMYKIELRTEGIPIGICGLIQRDYLEDADIGYALLPEFCGKGYAYESASAVMDYGKKVLDLNRIVGITSEDNERSAKLLEKLGMQFERMIQPSAGGEELMLYVPINE